MTPTAPEAAAPPCEPHPAYREAGVAAVATALAELLREAAAKMARGPAGAAREAA